MKQKFTLKLSAHILEPTLLAEAAPYCFGNSKLFLHAVTCIAAVVSDCDYRKKWGLCKLKSIVSELQMWLSQGLTQPSFLRLSLDVTGCRRFEQNDVQFNRSVSVSCPVNQPGKDPSPSFSVYPQLNKVMTVWPSCCLLSLKHCYIYNPFMNDDRVYPCARKWFSKSQSA